MGVAVAHSVHDIVARQACLGAHDGPAFQPARLKMLSPAYNTCF